MSARNGAASAALATSSEGQDETAVAGSVSSRNSTSSQLAARTEPAARPSALEVITARAEARALLWRCLEFDLHEAVDVLQAAAVASGLVAELGQDRVHALMAKAFHAVRT